MTAARTSTNLASTVDLLTGFPFKSSSYCGPEEGVRLVRGDNVIQRAIRWDGAKHWPSSLTGEFGKYRLWAGDVVLAMDRPWIEAGLKVAEIRAGDAPSLLVQRVARLRTRDPGLRQDYLKWLLYTPAFTQHVLSVQTGTAVPHISGGQILSFQFELPPLDEQRRIAGVLGVFDDLIDTNLRLKQRLHQIGRADYLAAVTAESSTVRLAEVVEFHNRARVPLSKDQRMSMPGSYPYYGATGQMDSVGKYIFDGVRILVGEDGSVVNVDGSPVVQMVWGKYWVNNHAHVLSGRGISDGLLRQALETSNVTPYVTGAVQPKLSMGRLKEVTISIPADQAVSERLDELAWAERQLVEESASLTAGRDELLPLLMSGRVTVDEAWEAVPA